MTERELEAMVLRRKTRLKKIKAMKVNLQKARAREHVRTCEACQARIKMMQGNGLEALIKRIQEAAQEAVEEAEGTPLSELLSGKKSSKPVVH